ncbi:expressed protein [Phakopsora pachyrhizi]|uniref:Expressed protein n=1 Tax=Phakopsora pachyrhizi TaxID=170000 RepID=A0AAV0BTT1_PHAPC|nr:expressed protein [Phakopsora pachyrhizi]
MLITPQRLLSRHGDHSTTSPNLQTQDGQFRKSSFRSRFLTSSTAPLRIIKKKASQSFVSSSITGKRIVSGLIGSIGTGKVTKGDHFDPVRAFKRQISYPVLNQSSQLHESEDEEDDKEEESSIKGLVNTLKCIGGTTPVASSSLFIMNEDEQAKRRLRTEIPWSTHVSSPVGSPHGSSPAFALSSPENGRQRLKPKISFTRLLKPKQSPEGLRATSPRALSGIISRKSSLSQLFALKVLPLKRLVAILMIAVGQTYC